MAGKRIIPAGPYVYALSGPDGVFYIGKGRRARMYQHAVDAIAGKPGRKCDHIREMLAAGHKVQYQVLGTYESDDEACQAERQYIAAQQHGLMNLSKGGEPGGAPNPRERMKREARRMLVKMLPHDQMVARTYPAAARAMAQMCGSPDAFWRKFRKDLQKQCVRPAPNTLTVQRDGSRTWGWE